MNLALHLAYIIYCTFSGTVSDALSVILSGAFSDARSGAFSGRLDDARSGTLTAKSSGLTLQTSKTTASKLFIFGNVLHREPSMLS